MKRDFLVGFALVFLTGCAPTLPSKSNISPEYSLLGAKTFTSQVECDNALVEAVRQDFVHNYCSVLESHIKLAIQKEYYGLTHVEENADIIIQSVLEQINGGSAAARFWIGFGAGRSVTTVHTTISRNGQPQAERRFTETTTMPNMVTGVWDNESAILQDAPLVAAQIAKFFKDPKGYEASLQNNIE